MPLMAKRDVDALAFSTDITTEIAIHNTLFSSKNALFLKKGVSLHKIGCALLVLSLRIILYVN